MLSRRILPLALLLCAAAQAQAPPNIVWIWADNLAYQDLGAYGSDRVKTPVIDRLARDGVKLNQYYVAHVVCSPSRAALLTGRQPFRAGIVDVLRPDGPSGLPSDELTLAEAMRERGYRTMAVGKWHLGDRREYLPLQHGFDRWVGLPYSMDMLPTLLYRDNEILDRLDGDKVQTVTRRMTDATIEFLEEGRGKPFFLYFAHTIPHPPLNLPPDAVTPGRAIYDDAIEHMDAEVGRLLAALDRLGLAQNTAVFFSSDNGPMDPAGNAGILRGRIRESYEGGVRVPFVARWPGHVPAGRTVDEPAIAYDVFPTLLGMAGGKVPADRVYDGQDIAPLLTGKGTFQRSKPFVWIYLDNVTAIRDGRWKLHVGSRETALPAPELYDLSTDPGESKNLAEAQPDVVTRLRAEIAKVQADVPHAWRLTYPVRDAAKKPGGLRRK